jgi:ABC-type antimicrobial peptide transport system permease subunit
MGIVSPAQPVIYLPPAQTKADFNLPFTLALKTGGDPNLLAAPVRRTLGEAWPAMPVSKVLPLTKIVETEMAHRGPMVLLASGLAGVALVLAILGIYGLLAFSVAQRIPEIGVRIALGAQASDIFGSVMRRGLILAGLGVGAGLVLSIQFVQLLRGLLYGVKPVDPASFALAPAAVLLIAFLACLIPARTALQVQPSEALRSE